MEENQLVDVERLILYNYEEDPFIVINKYNEDEVISKLSQVLFTYIVGNEDDGSPLFSTLENVEDLVNTHVSAGAFLTNFLKKLPKPITIVQKINHIDPCFRDSYYMYYSNQHFRIDRFSKRLSFFLGEYDSIDFFDQDKTSSDKLQNNFIGSCVINPLATGVLGRTLIKPEYALSSKLSNEENNVFVRLSDFQTHVFGRSLVVRAFPYRMQDGQTMCCTEVTLLNLLEYYSNTYNDYRSVVPSEIIASELNHSYERVLPVKGITYPVLTKTLSEFGFAPRLYNIFAIENFEYSSIDKETELKRWLHYYIESGIPVAINLVPKRTNGGTGHSIICIGHGPAKKEMKKKAYKKRLISWTDRDKGHPLINSADFYDDYVIIDDNSPVYNLRKFDALSINPNMRVENLAVPLYKRMYLDAPNAYSIIKSILQSDEFGIKEWGKDFLKEGENVVTRMFMASSRSYKEFRIQTLKGAYLKQMYAFVPLPRFVWVCELYRESDYDMLQAFGEVVIDATSDPSCGHRSLILMHYPKLLAYRSPDQREAGFDKMAQFANDELFQGYSANLDKVNYI